MNQKDYKAIVEIIYCQLHTIGHPISKGGKEALIRTAEYLAYYFEKRGFKETNFDRQQFLKDCGVDVE